MFSRLNAKALTPENAAGKLAAIANDTRASPGKSARFDGKLEKSMRAGNNEAFVSKDKSDYSRPLRARKEIWLKATRPHSLLTTALRTSFGEPKFERANLFLISCPNFDNRGAG